MKLCDVEVYEGDKDPVNIELQVSKVLDTSTDVYQIRVEVGETVFYLDDDQNNDLIYMLNNAN